MILFELEPSDISDLNDADLRELVGRLCEAEAVTQGLPTSKVNWGGAQEAPDGGLDVSVFDLGELSSPNFLPHPDTGFQVKKHSMSRANCKKEMLEKGSVRPIIRELAKRGGSYIIVSGKDDCSKDMLDRRIAGMNEAVEPLKHRKKLHLDFYGRDRIAAWLRRHPGVSLWARNRLGKPLSGWTTFGRWAATPEALEDDYLADDHPCVQFSSGSNRDPIPLIEAINETRKRVQPFGSATRITGLSGVGKTRFVQALFEEAVGEDALPSSATIYADLGEELEPTATGLVNSLIANDVAAILILDNCPPDVHRRLQKKVTNSGTKLRLITVEYDISDDKPEETEVVHIEPSSEETVSKLVRRRFPELNRVNADKISEFAGGNARVALALAARVGPEETLSSFSDEVLFKRLFNQRNETNTDLLECAEILSLVYSFNVSAAEHNDELATLARIGATDKRALKKAQAELLRRQLAQKRGNWRAVLPHALANKLARRALEVLEADEINEELFKPENIRLFKSCAHRVGYLHDCEPAQELAKSWIANGAPLHDLSKCDEQQLACLDYIAPVFPEVILSSLEEACRDVTFASRNNPKFSTFVHLLRHLAYDSELFERAVELMLRFAMGEKQGEKHDSVVSQIKQLFSLYLSGTLSSAQQRQDIVRGLFFSSNQREREISLELFHAALNANHWSSIGPFDFGARKRGYGWRPSNREEELEWYEGFIAILEQGLSSNDSDIVNTSKSLLADHFRGLWTWAGCFEPLEKLIRQYGSGGSWPAVWMAIKSAQYYDKKRLKDEYLEKLAELEAYTAPNDPYSEIEAYALTNTWDHMEFREGRYSENEEQIRDKVAGLGRLAAVERSYVDQLGDRLWEGHIDALVYFGMGIAEGSENKKDTFEFLVSNLRSSNAENHRTTLLFGYLRQVHDEDPALFRSLLESTLDEEKLIDHFVYLLSAADIAPWGTEKLIELAKHKAIRPWSFSQISVGRIHEPIPDQKLAELLTAILEMDDGVFVVFDILNMRFHLDKDSDYYPSEVVLAVGRNAIERFCAMHRDSIGNRHQHNLETVAEFCLKADAPQEQVGKIVRLLCDGVETFRLYSFDLGDLIAPLISNFSRLLLDQVYDGGEKEDMLAHMIFRERVSSRDEPALNRAPVSELIDWANSEQEKLEKLSKAIRTFSTVEAGNSSLDHPKTVAVSEHAKALLDVASDKEPVLQMIFEGAWPSGWSGSLADILEARATAFEELLSHPSDVVQASVSEKLEVLRQAVRSNREKESDEHNRREQRFE